MPVQHPNTGKTRKFGGFRQLSEFSIFLFSVFRFSFFLFFRFSAFPFSCFPVFPFFSVFSLSFRFSRFCRFFVFSFFFSDFRIFRFLGGRVSEETVPPQHRVYFPIPCPFPNPKATHPKQPNAVEDATMQVNCCWWLPPKLSINADTDVLCVSTEAKGCSSQSTEALGATQHAGQAWTAIKGFWFGMHTQSW